MNEAKRLTGYSYKLMGLGNIPGLPAQEQANQFGLDVSFGPDDLEIDENEMSCVIPFADGNRVDGSGDVIEVAGIRTERHRANPIVLFDHGKQVTLPVALSEDPITKLYTVEIDPIAKKAKGKAFFYQGKWGGKNFNGATEYDHALFCEQLFDLLAKRYIRAGSIGYQVMKGLPMQGTYGMGIPQGVHLQEVNMLEYSAVVLPCNQDTVGKALSLKRVCGKPLSTHLVKSLSPYAPARKAQMGYEGQKRHGTPEMWEGEGRHAGSTPTSRELHVNILEELGTPYSTRQLMREVADEAGTVDEHGQIRKKEGQKALTPGEQRGIDIAQRMQDIDKGLEQSANKRGSSDPATRQRVNSEENIVRRITNAANQRDQEGQKALTPQQRQEMMHGSRLNSDEENLQAAELMREIADLPVRGNGPVDVTDEILKPVEETQDKRQKSFSALLKSLREKYRKNYDMEELEGNMKTHSLPVQQGESLFSIGSNVDTKVFSDEWRQWEKEVREAAGREIPILNKIPDDEARHYRDVDPNSSPITTAESIAERSDRKLFEAISFLKSMVSEGFSLDETGRAKCYHYAKSLMPYGRKGDFSKTERIPKGSPSSTQEDRLSFLELHANPKETHYDSHGLSVGDAGYSRDRGMLLPSQEVMQRYQGPNPVAEAMPTPRPSREHDNFYQDVTSGGVEQEIHQTPQVYPQEIPDWHNDPLYLKSLERIIKMAIPENYDVGKEVVITYPLNPERGLGMKENEGYYPAQGHTLLPRENAPNDQARFRIGSGPRTGSPGRLETNRLTYVEEAFPNPPQEEDEQ